jgi:hypothetical protein
MEAFQMDWQKIRRIFAENKDNPPENEETTRFRVIDPILVALEYSRKDIYANRFDGSGGYPDYTILPNDENKFFLEAKAWNVPLKDDFILQATSYAYHKGHRWVVLTNGHEWQLFDSSIQGKSSDRLVLSFDFNQAKIDDTPPHIFKAICKESMISGRTEEYVAPIRLREMIEKELANPDSEIVAAIRRVIRKREGFGKVNGEMIAHCFAEGALNNNAYPIPVPFHVDNITKDLNSSCKTLSELEKDAPTGLKPVSVRFPDGSSKAIRSWKDMTTEILSWLSANNKMPKIPYSSTRGTTYFLNFSPYHQRTKMRSPTTLNYNGQKIYVETHGSASDLVSKTLQVCKKVGFTGDEFRIEIR